MMLRHHLIVPFQLMGQIFQSETVFWIVVLIYQGCMLHIYKHQNNLIVYFLIPFINKFHIFQNTYKPLIHGLRTFKYKNTCELCNNILDKYNIVRTMVKICFVLHEEVIDVFQFFLIPTIEKLSFHLDHFTILGSMECGKTKNYC